MAERAHFTPELFEFLRELKQNNNRDWFQANKKRYKAEVQEPLLHFIADFAEPLRRITPNLVADPRPVGGSMFRIYRDVRFSKDKSPYKTVASAHFRHRSGRDVHGPGYYLHLEPDNVFAGTGIWHPAGATLQAIRTRIVDDPEAWRRVLEHGPFASRHHLSGDSLKRAPRGFDPEHPLIDDLKRKDFVSIVNLTEAQVLAPGFINEFVEICQAAAPFMEYLAQATGLEW